METAIKLGSYWDNGKEILETMHSQMLRTDLRSNSDQPHKSLERTIDAHRGVVWRLENLRHLGVAQNLSSLGLGLGSRALGSKLGGSTFQEIPIDLNAQVPWSVGRKRG